MKIGENKFEIISSISRNLFFSFVIKKKKKRERLNTQKKSSFVFYVLKMLKLMTECLMLKTQDNQKNKIFSFVFTNKYTTNKIVL